MKLLFVHQNFPGQYKHVAPAMARRGHEVTALGISERPSMQGIRYVRYAPQRGSTKGIHPWAVDFETKLIRGEACLRAAQTLAQEGYRPDLICAHPGWGETLFLKELWPDVPQLHYLEFFYRSEGQDVGFDPELSKPNLDSRARLVAKNANNLLNLDCMDAGICPTQWQFSTLPTNYHHKIKVIHDGIDTASLRPNERAHISLKDEAGRDVHLKAGDPIVTYVARNLEPFRGYHQFMRALPAGLHPQKRHQTPGRHPATRVGGHCARSDTARIPPRQLTGRCPSALVPSPVLSAVPAVFSLPRASRIIVLAWVNDQDTRRAYENQDDAYRLFRKVMDSGHPPADWDEMLSLAYAMHKT